MRPLSGDWTVKSAFEGVARSSAVTFTLNNLAYVGTGIDNRSQLLQDFWQYNPTSNAWTQMANFPGKARSGAVAFALGSKGYVSTGSTGSTRYDDLWEFDPMVN